MEEELQKEKKRNYEYKSEIERLREEIDGKDYAKARHCHACGNEYIADSVYCRKCGEKRLQVWGSTYLKDPVFSYKSGLEDPVFSYKSCLERQEVNFRDLNTHIMR